MIDFHCHLDLYPNPAEVVESCEKRSMFVLSVTTTPSAWEGTDSLASPVSRIRTALGLHPQLAAERIKELPLFDDLLPRTCYVGEVGLDGSSYLRASWECQVRIFRHVLLACEQAGGRIISIHSRRAASDVLSHLEQYPDAGIPVLHWFSGTIAELERAKQMGCWFSVGPAMLAGKRGQEIAARLPASRTLTETDGPFAKNKQRALLPWDVELAVHGLANVWKMSADEVDHLLLNNLRSLSNALPPLHSQ